MADTTREPLRRHRTLSTSTTRSIGTLTGEPAARVVLATSWPTAIAGRPPHRHHSRWLIVRPLSGEVTLARWPACSRSSAGQMFLHVSGEQLAPGQYADRPTARTDGAGTATSAE
ncbi:hypothetical protein C9J85_19830 [Haloferax sp. wsp5]|nr:hypothetical protein C9J85_19830 [Haloferax sp. wsp5]